MVWYFVEATWIKKKGTVNYARIVGDSIFQQFYFQKIGGDDMRFTVTAKSVLCTFLRTSYHCHQAIGWIVFFLLNNSVPSGPIDQKKRWHEV